MIETIVAWARRPSRGARLAIVLAALALLIAGTLLLPRISQPRWYHDFADRRWWLGVPRAADVLSNVAFLIGGIAGLLALGRARFFDPRERIPWVVFFAGLLLTTFGSSYYHFAPDNARLFWDRLPMTVAFMGLADAIVAERISASAAMRLLPVLLAVGALSDLQWRWSEQMGRGDLRFYGLVQAGASTVPFLILLLFPPRYSRGGDFLWAAACYGAAKVAETLDKPIYSLGHIVSGHTLKHLFAGAIGLALARMLMRRQAISEPQSPRAAAEFN